MSKIKKAQQKSKINRNGLKKNVGAGSNLFNVAIMTK